MRRARRHRPPGMSLRTAVPAPSFRGWDRSPHRGMGQHSLSPAVPSQVCGVVFFSSSAAEQLLATHVIPPLDACTYMGLDSGAPPIQVTPPLG